MEPLVALATFVISLLTSAGLIGMAYGLIRGRLEALKDKDAALEKELDKKASKELVDGLTKQIDSLKDDLDHRFDKLEDLINSK